MTSTVLYSWDKALPYSIVWDISYRTETVSWMILQLSPACARPNMLNKSALFRSLPKTLRYLRRDGATSTYVLWVYIDCLFVRCVFLYFLGACINFILWFLYSLPEVPPDTAETNTLMDVDNLPQWSKVTPSSVYRACGKLAIMYETELSKHCEQLAGKFL